MAETMNAGDVAVLVHADLTPEQKFAVWFEANYPGPHTVIHDPRWHAPKIFRAAMGCISRTELSVLRPKDGESTR